MAVYRVVLPAKVDDQPARLGPRMYEAGLALIYERIAVNPRRLGHPLRDELAGTHSARLGREHRVLYEIDEEQRTVVIVEAGRRSDIYRSR